MNICQIGSFSYNPEDGRREIKTIGGISGYINDLVNFLMVRNHNVIFVGKIYFMESRGGLKYIEVQKKVTSTNKFLLALFFKSFFVHLSSDTIIHAHRPDHLTAFAWFRKNHCVITLHGQQLKNVNNRKGIAIRVIYKILEIIALKKASVVLATDKITEQYYLSIYPFIKHKIKILPTGINTKMFSILDKYICRTKTDIGMEDKIVMYIGRIELPKRIEDIILSFQLVHQVYAKTKMVIIGDGVFSNRMESFVRKLNLQNCIMFTGALMREELPVWINAADVTVLYSYNEGSPLSVKESLACGIPVIANKVGDVGEIIVNGVNGYLIEQEDNLSFSELIKKCLYNSSIKREDCVDSIRKYSLDSINQSVELIYSHL